MENDIFFDDIFDATALNEKNPETQEDFDDDLWKSLFSTFDETFFDVLESPTTVVPVELHTLSEGSSDDCTSFYSPDHQYSRDVRYSSMSSPSNSEESYPANDDSSGASSEPADQGALDIGADVIIQTTDVEDDLLSRALKEAGAPVGKTSIELTFPLQVEVQCNSTDHEELMITEEEEKMLTKEGLTIPCHLPLTKEEEKELKRIRRKIRNKQSAQDSRKKKKEYTEGLEKRVRYCTVQNAALQKKVEKLQQENQSLSNQLKNLKVFISNSSIKPVQTSTCFLVLVLSFALFLTPAFKSNTSVNVAVPKQPDSHVPGLSRSLLHASDSEELKLQVKEDAQSVLYAERLHSRSLPPKHVFTIAKTFDKVVNDSVEENRHSSLRFSQ